MKYVMCSPVPPAVCTVDIELVMIFMKIFCARITGCDFG